MSFNEAQSSPSDPPSFPVCDLTKKTTGVEEIRRNKRDFGSRPTTLLLFPYIRRRLRLGDKPNLDTDRKIFFFFSPRTVSYSSFFQEIGFFFSSPGRNVSIRNILEKGAMGFFSETKEQKVKNPFKDLHLLAAAAAAGAEIKDSRRRRRRRRRK